MPLLPRLPRLGSFIAGVKWDLGGGPPGRGTVRGLCWAPFGRGSPGDSALPAMADPKPGDSYPRGARTQRRGSQLSDGIFQLLKLWVLFLLFFFF